MKDQRKIRTTMVVWVTAVLLGLLVLGGCGKGGGGGSSSNQNQGSHWDTMVWDQGNWQ